MTEPIVDANATAPGFRLGPVDAARWAAAADRARTETWAKRLFERDPSLWSSDPAVQSGISERLGWLDAADHFREQIPALEGFGEGLRADGFRSAVIGGMGGSSLAPEVLQRTFGSAPDWLELRVLDGTSLFIFELVSVLLLIAIVGSVWMGQRRPEREADGPEHRPGADA